MKELDVIVQYVPFRVYMRLGWLPLAVVSRDLPCLLHRTRCTKTYTYALLYNITVVQLLPVLPGSYVEAITLHAKPVLLHHAFTIFLRVGALGEQHALVPRRFLVFADAAGLSCGQLELCGWVPMPYLYLGTCRTSRLQVG